MASGCLSCQTPKLSDSCVADTETTVSCVSFISPPLASEFLLQCGVTSHPFLQIKIKPEMLCSIYIFALTSLYFSTLWAKKKITHPQDIRRCSTKVLKLHTFEPVTNQHLSCKRKEACALQSPDEILPFTAQSTHFSTKLHKGKSFNICMQLLSAKQTWQRRDS